MLEDREAPFRLNLIDDVADTHRPKEHGLALGAADRLGWRAARPQDVVCHYNHSFSIVFHFKGHLTLVASASALSLARPSMMAWSPPRVCDANSGSPETTST